MIPFSGPIFFFPKKKTGPGPEKKKGRGFRFPRTPKRQKGSRPFETQGTGYGQPIFTAERGKGLWNPRGNDYGPETQQRSGAGKFRKLTLKQPFSVAQ
nr:MAG TPA: hypothetical protein [Caudoviricetes sp.]